MSVCAQAKSRRKAAAQKRRGPKNGRAATTKTSKPSVK